MKSTLSVKNCLLALVASFTILSACQKSQVTPSPTPVTPGTGTTTATRAELTKDSIYLYAQQTYFWNAEMPTYDAFNPRKYTSNQGVLNAIMALPSPGKPTDKYSFIDEGAVAGAIGGSGGDFGFSVFYNGAPSSDLRIKYVYPGSPADVLGIKRGDRITKLNGRTDLSSSSQAAIDAINNALFGSSNTMTLTVLKSNSTTADLTLSRGAYTINPVLYSNTYTVGTKKVGYIVFNSFTTNALSKLDAAFAKFATDGISEIIVDLRYNGGGSVQTAVDFTNLIAPSAQNGNTMFTTYFNTTMQSGQATILKNQKFWGVGNDGVTRQYSFFDYSYLPTYEAGNLERFQKRGSANGITRAYFLVTGGTASASELLINNLKPVIDVKLIGRTTYGKPVGFFAMHIDNLDLYIPQFQTRNSVNNGEYFNGMPVDVDIADDVTKDFGDVNEKYLAYALNYSLKGNFNMALPKLNLLNSLTPISKVVERDLADELSQHEFKGMIETRMKLKH